MDKWIQKLHLELFSGVGTALKQSRYKELIQSFIYTTVFMSSLLIFVWNYLVLFVQYKGIGMYLGFVITSYTIVFYIYLFIRLLFYFLGRSIEHYIKRDWYGIIVWLGISLAFLLTGIYHVMEVFV